MTEELKQKAEGYAETLIKQKMANHDIFVKEEAKREIMNVYIAGATELQEIMKKNLVSELKELISYSTSPSCTKGMELFIKRIENWEFIK